MTNYYIDSVLGNDANTGAFCFPFKTTTKINAMTLNAGDHVFFKRGQTFQPLIPKGSGTAGNPIIFDAYGDGETLPIINGSATNSSLYIPLSTSNPVCFLEFHNLFFNGGSSVVARVYSHDILLEDCVVKGVLSPYGIASSAMYADTVHDNIFRRCEVYGATKSGIIIGVTHPGYPYNMVIEDCDVHNNGTSISADHGIYVDAGVEVRRNKVYNNAAGGIKCNSEFGIDMRYLPKIYDNEVYGNKMGIVMAHHYMAVWNNLVYSNEYNLMWENAVSYCKVYFNTFVNSSKPSASRGISWNANLNRSNDMRNNLIIQDRAIVAREVASRAGGKVMSEIPPVNVIDYNVYYQDGNDTSRMFIQDVGTSLTFPQWRALAGSPDAHGENLYAVPDFVSRYTDFHPVPDGNLVGKGIAIAGYSFDKDGNPRQDPPTPGCYDIIPPPVNPNADEIENLELVIAELSQSETLLTAKIGNLNQNMLEIDNDIVSLQFLHVDLELTRDTLQSELANIRGAITDIQDTIDSLEEF